MSGESGGNTTIIYDVNLGPVESMLTEQNELLTEQREFIQASVEELHGDAAVLIASVWLLCGIVVGAAVGILIYRLWRS